MKLFSYFLTSSTIFLLLTSCAGVRTAQAKRATSEHYATQALQLADASSGQEKQQYLLQSAEQFVAAKNVHNSQQVLAQIDSAQLSPHSQMNYLILKAQIALTNKQPQAALTDLIRAQASNIAIDTTTQIKIQQLYTQAYFATDRILAALNSSTNAYLLMSDANAKLQCLFVVWQHLKNLSVTQYQDLLTEANNDTQRGWLQLALITDNHTLSAAQAQAQIQQWEEHYPNHPAQYLLQSSFGKKLLFTRPPQRIALLLPLNGALGQQGQAIRNGFFAAYYQEKTSGYAPKILVFDTSQDNINSLYQQAIQQGADIVVGPLLKADIENLISSQHLTIPTIALNTIPNDTYINNLFQFGLDPNSETEQVAQKIWDNNENRVLIIAPNDSWGNRITATFENDWQTLGGQVADKIAYQSRSMLTHQLQHLLGLDSSRQRYLTLHHLLKEKLRYVPRRREDFNAIFLVATPSMGRQIVPLLHFYYTNHVPTYSISQIAPTDAKTENDLEGVIFDDIPWLFSDNTLLPEWLKLTQQQIQTTWPKSYKQYPRFYALGADAYALTTKISEMSLIPNWNISSATGELHLQANGKIYRKLIWAKIKNGHAQLLPD